MKSRIRAQSLQVDVSEDALAIKEDRYFMELKETKHDLENHSLARTIVLHLLPGLLILLFYIATAPIALKTGFPPLMALLIAVGVVLIPFELGYLIFQAKKRNGAFSLSWRKAYGDRL